MTDRERRYAIRDALVAMSGGGLVTKTIIDAVAFRFSVHTHTVRKVAIRFALPRVRRRRRNV